MCSQIENMLLHQWTDLCAFEGPWEEMRYTLWLWEIFPYWESGKTGYKECVYEFAFLLAHYKASRGEKVRICSDGITKMVYAIVMATHMWKHILKTSYLPCKPYVFLIRASSFKQVVPCSACVGPAERDMPHWASKGLVSPHSKTQFTCSTQASIRALEKVYMWVASL